MQITRTTPLRLMILHLSQIFLTLARTFMFQIAIHRRPMVNDHSPTPIQDETSRTGTWAQTGRIPQSILPDIYSCVKTLQILDA
jgi:hypothetical protein